MQHLRLWRQYVTPSVLLGENVIEKNIFLTLVSPHITLLGLVSGQLFYAYLYI